MNGLIEEHHDAIRDRGSPAAVTSLTTPADPAGPGLPAEFYRAVVRRATLLVLVIDEERVRWVSPAVEELLGPGVAGEPVEALRGE